MRVYIVFAILALIALFILVFRGGEIASSRKDRSTPAVASNSPGQTAFESRLSRGQEPRVDGPKATAAATAAKRFYREAVRTEFKALYYKTRTKFLRDEVNRLSATRIELNVSKGEVGKLKGTREYKNAVEAGAKLESANHRLWESLLKQKYFEEILSLARNRPQAFARRQRIARPGDPTLSYLLGRRLLHRRGEQKQ